MKPTTELLRKINPHFLQDGRVSCQAFRPAPNDQCALPVYDGDQIDPSGAYGHFTEKSKVQSSGIQAVTVDECAKRGLHARPATGSFPECALIDFSGLQKRQVEAEAKQLRAWAEARGWRYRAEVGS